MAVVSKHVALQVLEALGLPVKRCLSLNLDFQHDCVVVATAEYAPNKDELDAVTEIVRRLKVIEEF